MGRQWQGVWAVGKWMRNSNPSGGAAAAPHFISLSAEGGQTGQSTSYGSVTIFTRVNVTMDFGRVRRSNNRFSPLTTHLTSHLTTVTTLQAF